MSDPEWVDDEPEQPRKKRRIPTWVWFGCGGGCLVATILIAFLAWFGFQKIQEMQDPDVVWPRIAEILPFDERPAGWVPSGFGAMGTGQYQIRSDGGEYLIIASRFRTTQELEDALDPESRINQGFFGINQISNPEPGTIEIQGRETRCLRFDRWFPESAREKGITGASIRIDVTGAGEVAACVDVTLPHAERVADADAAEALAPFDVWRGR